MNAKILVFVICIETIIYLLLYNLHDCTFKEHIQKENNNFNTKAAGVGQISKIIKGLNLRKPHGQIRFL